MGIGDTEHGSPSRPRLLLAEGNSVDQQAAVAMLDEIGYRADVVVNGAQAVAALSRITYGAVLMDCQMPVMDGYDASREIRRGEGGDRHTPIIAMTANAMRGDRERCLAAGMDDHIAKPIELAALHAVLGRWVAHEEPAPDAPAPPAATGRRFDHDQVAMLRTLHIEGEPDIFALSGQIFLDTAPGALATLRESIARCDDPATARAAHSLKGSGASLGAAGLARACAELEAATKLGGPQAKAAAFARVAEELCLAQAWLVEQIGLADANG